MINSTRLASLLKPLSFSLVIDDGRFILFSRPDVNPALFQQIDIEFQGKNNEAVYAYALISCMKWTLGESGDSELIFEIAKDKDHGCTIIENNQQAATWESQLCANIVPHLTLLSQNTGQLVYDKNKDAIKLSKLVLPELERIFDPLRSTSLNDLFTRTTLDLAS